jgi:integrase
MRRLVPPEQADPGGVLKWLRTWAGGRVRQTDDGKEVFYIQKRIGNGVRRNIALDVLTEKEAEVELRLFERDPLGYKTKRQAVADRVLKGSGGVRLDPDTLEEFIKFCDRRVEKGDLTAEYVSGVLRCYLRKWTKDLGGKDLASLNLDDLQKVLKKYKGVAEHKRVVALKAFTAWAREEKEAPKLLRSQDPTTDLKTPPIVPEKSMRAKGYAIKLVEQMYERIPNQRVRDVILLRAKLGMHDSEIRRIALGQVALRRVADPSGIEGTIAFQHLKKGKPHVVSCDASTFAAAERMVAGKAVVERKTVARNLKTAAERMVEDGAVKKEPVVHPNELRHSFATWATTVGEEVWPLNQKGVDLTKVAEAMGHLGKRTTSFFYVGDRVPMMIRLPITLSHPEDPVALVQREKGKQAG